MSSTTPTPTSTAEIAPKMTHREVLEALSGILLGMFVSILATSVVSSSLPRIISDLDGTQSAFTWVVTATLLTTTISTPIWGKLADLVDRKLLIQLALAISVISSALAGFSHDTGMLIGMRALQGIGAGGLTALGTVLIADIISPRERGKYMGLMGAVMGIGMVGGPLLGGVITDSAGWRWNFFLGLPFAVAAIIVLQRTLHLPARKSRQVTIDYAGATLLSIGIATLLLWITFAGTSFDWASWQTAAMLGGSLLALALAVWVESRAAEPIIPLHLFKNRTLVLSVVASIAVGVAMFGTTVFLSQYMQLARGKTPTQSGLLTIPMIVGLLVSSTISGQIISRTGKYKKFMIAGAVLLTTGTGLMGTIHFDTSFTLVSLYLVVIGAGVGMLMQNLVLAVQNTLDVREVGSGTSTVAFFRTLGGALGVSALGVVLSHRVTDLMATGLTAIGIDPSAMGSDGAIPDLSTLPENIRMVVEQAFGNGVADLFLVATPVALISLIAVLFLKEVPLGNRSGIEQLLEQEAAMLAPATSEAAVDAELETLTDEQRVATRD
ncbi:MDR family MFS transporter [Cellulomonas sp. Root137]|uniref:MDR family MFS transporter n=1 Tax=Cellulomonas sp. Root137 TaxID=1736459 RepID=UPI0006F960F5|nr:MDR family MFS transporter [Cellulomonas sp. Root137]KQY47073.1 multidrug MFS transporter [Cellulomonas sp. Root137]KRD44216.1 multidrug MFS transporter [Cellulomonas sp. Root930]